MIEVSNLRIPLKQLNGNEEDELLACRRAAARKLGIKERRIHGIESAWGSSNESFKLFCGHKCSQTQRV